MEVEFSIIITEKYKNDLKKKRQVWKIAINFDNNKKKDNQCPPTVQAFFDTEKFKLEI